MSTRPRGVDEKTVRKARTVNQLTVNEPRLDGKTRKMPTRTAPEITEDSPSELKKAFQTTRKVFKTIFKKMP